MHSKSKKARSITRFDTYFASGRRNSLDHPSLFLRAQGRDRQHGQLCGHPEAPQRRDVPLPGGDVVRDAAARRQRRGKVARHRQRRQGALRDAQPGKGEEAIPLNCDVERDTKVLQML